NVFVKVFTNSLFLVHMDLAHSQEEVDPKYLWTGPDGKNLEGRKNVNLAEKGKLMVMAFTETMSGAYTCTLPHEEKEKCFRHISLWYMVSEFIAVCSSTRVHGSFLPPPIVNPFAPGWEEVSHQVPHDCEDATSARVQEARDQLGEVFSKHTCALKQEFPTVPTTHNVDTVTHTDSCRPGFGKNDITPRTVTMLCDPRTHSPNNGATCQICTRPRVKKYGARSR
ncbi:PREDICTED: zona pellucida-binding protein 2-like, partial [Tauraco erythrolophus]|uniref:zona pellucida-binding protein 2-like n=1 Tax=Tauraco erythrolophus TaxID=121530 RepID=UPI0005233FCC